MKFRSMNSTTIGSLINHDFHQLEFLTWIRFRTTTSVSVSFASLPLITHQELALTQIFFFSFSFFSASGAAQHKFYMYRIAPPPIKRRIWKKKAPPPNKHRGPDMIKIKRRQFCYFNTENNNTVFSTILCRVQPSNWRRPQISAALEWAQHLRRERFNKHRGAYTLQYTTD